MEPHKHNTFYEKPPGPAITVEKIDRVLANISGTDMESSATENENETAQVAIGRHGSQLERSLNHGGLNVTTEQLATLSLHHAAATRTRQLWL
jgi:hypothetical protein